MKIKLQKFLATLRVKSKALPKFAPALRAPYGVAAFGKDYGHYRQAAPCLAALLLTANAVFN